ncbi:hypothetical protein Tco_1477228 [Tanacetum coccineum]
MQRDQREKPKSPEERVVEFGLFVSFVVALVGLGCLDDSVVRYDRKDLEWVGWWGTTVRGCKWGVNLGSEFSRDWLGLLELGGRGRVHLGSAEVVVCEVEGCVGYSWRFGGWLVGGGGFWFGFGVSRGGRLVGWGLWVDWLVEGVLESGVVVGWFCLVVRVLVDLVCRRRWFGGHWLCGLYVDGWDGLVVLWW